MSTGFDNSGNSIAELAQFDLSREIEDSEQRKPWQSGLYSKTLYKREDFRTVLFSMETGAKLKEHHADGTLSVHVLKGSIRLAAQGKSVELQAGQLLTLAASLKHDVESLADSAFLLTISWPSPEKLLAMKHRGY